MTADKITGRLIIVRTVKQDRKKNIYFKFCLLRKVQIYHATENIGYFQNIKVKVKTV